MYVVLMHLAVLVQIRCPIRVAKVITVNVVLMHLAVLVQIQCSIRVVKVVTNERRADAPGRIGPESAAR